MAVGMRQPERKDIMASITRNATISDWDTMYLLFQNGKSKQEIGDIVGKSNHVVHNSLRFIQAMQEKDFETARKYIDSRRISPTVSQEWCRTRLGITLPEPQPEPEPVKAELSAPEMPASDNTGKAVVSILTQLSAQSGYLKTISEAAKTYGVAVVNDLAIVKSNQTAIRNELIRASGLLADIKALLEKNHAALSEEIQIQCRDARADLKDNWNANADVLRAELAGHTKALNGIEKNTRKRGL